MEPVLTDTTSAPLSPPARASTRGDTRIEGSSPGDRVYRWTTMGMALVIPILLLAIAVHRKIPLLTMKERMG